MKGAKVEAPFSFLVVDSFALFIPEWARRLETGMRRSTYRIAFWGLALFMLTSLRPASAMQLITQEEAKLPPPREALPLDRRGILRGPKIHLVLPEGPVQSPLHLIIKFQAFGGAKIDPESVRMTYLRTPNVDLTARVKPFVHDSGMDIPDTELPTGEYEVRLDLKDSDGRPGAVSFTLKVVPP